MCVCVGGGGGAWYYHRCHSSKKGAYHQVATVVDNNIGTFKGKNISDDREFFHKHYQLT